MNPKKRACFKKICPVVLCVPTVDAKYVLYDPEMYSLHQTLSLPGIGAVFRGAGRHV